MLPIERQDWDQPDDGQWTMGNDQPAFFLCFVSAGEEDLSEVPEDDPLVEATAVASLLAGVAADLSDSADFL